MLFTSQGTLTIIVIVFVIIPRQKNMHQKIIFKIPHFMGQQ